MAHSSTSIPHDPAAEPDLDAVIERGQRGLRFPPRLEVEFEADTVAARRRLLIICGMIGMVGIWFGTDIVVKMVPETAALTIRTQWLLLALSSVSQCISWLIPKAHWKTRYFEFITTLNTMVVGATAVWGTTMSHGDVIFTHSAVVIGVLMYAGIAARQRFRWTFASSTLTFVGYCLFTQGNTPLQQLIVHSNILMLALGLVLTLIASYGFEFRERRAWLLRRQSWNMQASLARASDRLRELSVRDPLTNLYNRRHFDAELDRAFASAATRGQPLAMLMLDVDFFKRYNDSHGHPAGDACLKSVARVLSDIGAHEGGVVGRLGGEEFGMALPGRSSDAALAVAHRVCAELRELGIEHRTSLVGPHVTASVGVAAIWPGRQGASQHALVQMTDQALYRAKHAGRDRAEAWPEADLPSTPVVVSETNAVAAMPGASSAVRAEIDLMNKVLAGGFRWLFFPKVLEALYQAQHQVERKRHLILASVLGMLTFNAYNYASRAMYADVAPAVLKTVLTLTVIMLVASGISAFMTVKAWLLETLYALGTTVVAVVMVQALSQSQSFTVYGYAVALFLIPMFACVVAQQPFWFAMLPTLATLFCLGMFKPGTPLEQLVMQDTAIMVINATFYTLIAAYALERGARKEWLLHEIGLRQRHELESTSRHLQQLSVSDPLTGLSNRRQFEAEFERIWSACAFDLQPVGVLIMDVDFFKHFNDHHGHPAGDRCLQQVATVLTKVAASEQSFAARLGGEEFAILLPARTLDQAMLVGQKVCTALREACIEHGFSAAAPHVTLSVGAASLLAGANHSGRELLKAADGALYQAKSAGRNRVGPVEAAHQAQVVAEITAG